MQNSQTSVLVAVVCFFFLLYAVSHCILNNLFLYTHFFRPSAISHIVRSDTSQDSGLCRGIFLYKIEMLRHGTKLREMQVMFKRGGGKAATLCSIHLQSLEGRRASVLPSEDIVHAPVWSLKKKLCDHPKALKIFPGMQWQNLTKQYFLVYWFCYCTKTLVLYINNHL